MEPSSVIRRKEPLLPANVCRNLKNRDLRSQLKRRTGALEMTPRLGALAAPPDDASLVLNTSLWTLSSCHRSSSRSKALFRPALAFAHAWHTLAPIHTEKRKRHLLNKLFLKRSNTYVWLCLNSWQPGSEQKQASGSRGKGTGGGGRKKVRRGCEVYLETVFGFVIVTEGMVSHAHPYIKIRQTGQFT